MDALAELHQELRLINEVIAILERIAAGRGPQRRRHAASSTKNLSKRPGLREISQSLRRRFDEASAAYKSASQEYHRLMDIVKDVESVSPDGHRALMQAMQVQQHALLKYERASKDLWDFTRHGKLPADSEPEV